MLIQPSVWTRYSRSLSERIAFTRYTTIWSQEDADARNLHLAIGQDGSLAEGSLLMFYWLVDLEDGVIVDAGFRAFGPSALIGAADVFCELCMRKNYDQAKRIGAELIDKAVQDRLGEHAFPEETAPLLNRVLMAAESAAFTCAGIPCTEALASPPVLTEETYEYPNWESLSESQQMSIVEEVIALEIRPYVELDAGGVNVVRLIDNREVHIVYQGACTTCHSATGGTLSAIQEILRRKVHPNLLVIPDL